MIVSSASPLSRMVLAKSRWSSVSAVSSSRPLMPITAFIGVRVSWLMVARNALLASLAVSAAARAFWASLNKAAFWIAITAWSANISSSAISLAVNPWRIARAMNKAPTPRPCHTIGATMREKFPILAAMRQITSGTPLPCSVSG